MPDGNALVFIDNHDNQRGHGGGGSLLTFRESKLYKVLTSRWYVNKSKLHEW